MSSSSSLGGGENDGDADEVLRPTATAIPGMDRVRPEVLAEIRGVFAMFSDADGATMDVRHVAAAFNAMGVDATDTDFIAAIDPHDPEGLGHITRDQWTQAIVQRLAEDGTRRRELRARLAAADRTGYRRTGTVPVGHLRQVLDEMVPEWLTAVDVDFLVAAADSAGTGLVDYDEFMSTAVRAPRVDRGY